MAEYIEREAAIKVAVKALSTQTTVVDLVVDMNEIPAADVQEVRHGKWIPSVFGTIICSECKERFSLFGSDTDKFYYCPNCGAKMDRGDDNA